MHPRQRLLVACAVASVALAGCSSTRLSSSWSDPAFAGRSFQKLLIIGLGASEGGRAEFENSVADALLAHGVTGVSSTGYFASAAEMTRDAVATWARRDGYQGVLVARIVDVQREQRVVGPTYTDLWGYWGYYGRVMTAPGYVEEHTTLLIDIDLFDAATGRVAYSAQSKTSNPSSREKVIRELTALIVDELSKRGLLPKQP